MSGMKVFWRFASDVAEVTVSSTETGYRASNMQLNSPSSLWKSQATLATETMTWAQDAAVTVSAFALGNHNFLDTFTLTLEYADDLAFSAGVEIIPVTFRNEWLLEYFTGINKQYGRLTVLKDAASTAITAGRLLSGDHYELERSVAVGYSIGPGLDTTKKVRTEGGVLYSDIGIMMDRLTGKLVGLPQADHDELVELQNTYRTGVPFLVSVDYDSFPLSKTIYGTLDKTARPVNIAGDKWNFDWPMTEQK